MTDILQKRWANYALDLLDVDKEGLDQTDRGLLLIMIEKFQEARLDLIRWLRQSARMRDDRGCI